jgi:hypothetical protein
MSGKQAVIAVLAVIMCILGGSASAQEENNEVTGMIGRIFISDQGLLNEPPPGNFVHFGKGLSFEANYARRFLVTPIFALSGEVPAVFNLDEKLLSGYDVVPGKIKQIFVTPAARLNLFPETAFSPWISLGGGFAYNFSESKTLYFSGNNPGSSSASGVLQGGFGLDVRVWHLFSIRGEVRDFWSGTPNLPLADTGKSRENNYFVGGGVVWHF